jgi:catechol 2,3-dioxygenase-like lactoylglutathione lyase family enzyme
MLTKEPEANPRKPTGFGTPERYKLIFPVPCSVRRLVVKLAKDVLDFGLYTVDLDAMLEFWQSDAGLPYEEMLPAGRGVRQHRHTLNGSVFKLNHSREPLPNLPQGGYRELLIAREGIEEERRLVDPDGNCVRLVPPGFEEIEGIGIRLSVHSPSAHDAFYGEVLELDPVGAQSYRWGNTVLSFTGDPAVPADAPMTRNEVMRAPGFRYLTVQVWDVDAEYVRAIDRGAMPGFPPMTLGKVARIAFIRDPDGNWIEISQRASLTGSLPG